MGLAERRARFQDRYVFTQFRFYERAELTASGRPLKIDRQMIPPFIMRPDNPAANNNEILRQKNQFGKPRSNIKVKLQ